MLILFKVNINSGVDFYIPKPNLSTNLLFSLSFVSLLGPNIQQQVPLSAYQSQFNYDPSRPLPNTSNYPPLQLGHQPTYTQGGITPDAIMYHHTPQTDLNPPTDQDGEDST